MNPLHKEHQDKLHASRWAGAMVAAIEASGQHIEYGNTYGYVSDSPDLAHAIIDSEGAWLPHAKAYVLARLDDIFEANYTFEEIVRSGMAVNLTPADLSQMMCDVVTNYRALRTQIGIAATAEALDKIDITAGWPANA